jgi:electron transfer flavoprotein alpha subunit
MYFSKYVKDEISVNDKPELTSAKIVVAGGRALKSKENFELMEDLAKVN